MRIFIIILFLFLSFTAKSQEKMLPPTVVKYIHERIAAGLNPSIAVGIITKDGPQYFSFGKKKWKGKKVNEHTIYEIGSITKVFTAILLADMHLKGELNIEDPVSKFLPAHVRVPSFNGQQITLGHLSDHTSSLPRVPDNLVPENYMNPYADYSVEELYAFLSSYELTRPIGSEYGYSNLAVGLLGNVLADVSDQPFENLVLSRITQPLNMNETRIKLTRRMKKNMATGHQQQIAVPNWDLPAIEGAGALKSSVHDLLIFLAANMQFFDHPLEKAMQLSHQVRHEKDGKVGLGWHIEKSTRGDIYWHNGGTGGFASFAGFNKALGMGVVVLTNSTETVDKIGFHLLDPGAPLPNILPHVAIQLKEKIEKEGPANLEATYDQLKKDGADKYDFSEEGINSLGYYFLNRKQFAEAKAVFLLNIREYPTSGNVYDSYAEALMENSEKELAIEHYKKSLEINPGNTNAVNMLGKLGVVYEAPLPLIDESILENYVGTYEFTPAFSIIVTREGSQLHAQATGQSSFPIFPKAANEFYYKVVDAQVTFNRNAQGKVESLSLHQNGRVIDGKKIR